jgi:hypothetical protein
MHSDDTNSQNSSSSSNNSNNIRDNDNIEQTTVQADSGKASRQQQSKWTGVRAGDSTSSEVPVHAGTSSQQQCEQAAAAAAV